jgi:hypothetical protein
MKTSMRLVTLIAAALLTACASRPTPVPVMGLTSDLNALVGEWSGDYSNPETGRSGSIAFSLKAGKDTAVGSVVMVPGDNRQQITMGAPVDRPAVRTSVAAGSSEVLTIRFVRMEGSHLVGTLDTYRDPDCGCELTTTFHGQFTDAGTITGTFTSTGSTVGHLPSSGRWTVKRIAQ